jgi:hypothetical protein
VGGRWIILILHGSLLFRRARHGHRDYAPRRADANGFERADAHRSRGSYDDVTHVLDLRIQMQKRPLYDFAEVRFSGLNPDLEGRAKRLWRAKPGGSYDYAYPNEFFQAFSRTVDFRNFRKYDAVTRKGTGDHVMDINLIFESR